MDPLIFRKGMDALYAAHGKAVPSSGIIDAVWKRIQDKPDGFMLWAASQLADYERLPSNLGLELEKTLFPAWRASASKPRPNASVCTNCDPHTPGFFQWWKQQGGTLYSGLCRCICNADPALGHTPAKSRAQARAAGLIILPDHWQGTPVSFEQQHFLIKRGKFDSSSGRQPLSTPHQNKTKCMPPAVEDGEK